MEAAFCGIVLEQGSDDWKRDQQDSTAEDRKRRSPAERGDEVLGEDWDHDRADSDSHH